jgi:hypothetical protein
MLAVRFLPLPLAVIENGVGAATATGTGAGEPMESDEVDRLPASRMDGLARPMLARCSGLPCSRGDRTLIVGDPVDGLPASAGSSAGGGTNWSGSGGGGEGQSAASAAETARVLNNACKYDV